ncbi:phage minor capsid protein [Microbispora sp. NPDC049633]|uniref:phage minor capsid protein n=1 Tax=Microbispora sp. NPDC049633 TaxID=3154355 RepID=UPI003431B55D
MAVDPDLVDQITSTIADLYREVETALIKTVAQRLRQDIPLPSPYQEAKLEAVQALRRSAQAILAAVQAARTEVIRRAVADAYRHGQGAALADLPESWFPRSGIGQAARTATREQLPNAAVVENIATALHRDLGRVDSNILRAPLDAYRAVQAGTAARVATGAFTRREASQAAWQRLIDKGITSFTDRAGRVWRLSSYVEMIGRTNIQRAAIQGQTDRLKSIGMDLVIVSNAPQECKLCRPYEGKILAINGPTGKVEVEHATKDGVMVTVDVVATLDQARADGFQHPNCRHSVSAYQAGITRIPKNTADPEGDKARQKQRALERKIRAAKEQAEGALTDEAKKEANRKVRAAQAELRAHLKANPKLKRLPYREQIGAGNLPKPGGPSGGPVADLEPPVQPTLDGGPAPRPGAAAVPEPARPGAPARGQLSLDDATPVRRDDLAAQQQAAEEAAAKARRKAEERARREAEEAAARARQEAERQARLRAQAPGMRQALRHRTNADGLQWARDRMPIPDLTDAERQAVRDYTGPRYQMVNNGLRGNLPSDPRQRAHYEQILQGSDAAFRKARAPQAFIAHRGVGSRYAQSLGADVRRPETMKALVGRVFSEPGFMSTSVGANAAFAGDVYLMIRVPDGYGAMNVMPISRFGEDEREILIRRNSRYVVHAVYKGRDERYMEDDVWFMELELVPDDWEKPAGWTPDPYGDAAEGYR